MSVRRRSGPPVFLLVLVAGLALVGCGDEPPPARVGFDALPAQGAGEVFALHNRGLALLEQYQPIAAMELFEQVLARAPGWTTARYNLGLCQLNSGLAEHHAPAEATLRRVIAEAPDDPHGPFALAMLMGHLGRLGEAQALLRRTLELDPEDADAMFQLAVLLVEREPAEAERLLKAVLERIPHHQGAAYRLFQLLQDAGDMAGAQVWLERFRTLQRAGAGYRMSLNYGEMGRHADALRPARPWPAAPDLPLPAYVDGAAARGLTGASAGTPGWPGQGGASPGPGVAVFDVDGDGALDMLVAGVADPRFPGSADAIGLFPADADGDGDTDVFVTRDGVDRYWRNDGGGEYRDATTEAGLGGAEALSLGAAWADADHDGDLDLFVAVPGGADRLHLNQGQGTFVEVAAAQGLAALGGRSVGAAFLDLDEDDDLDLVVLVADGPNHVVRNERMGGWRVLDASSSPLATSGPSWGLALGDPDGDARVDVLLLGGVRPPVLLLSSRGLQPDPVFAAAVAPLEGVVSGTFADLDLDGRQEVVLFGSGAGEGPFAWRVGEAAVRPLVPRAGPAPGGPPAGRALLAVDLDGDGGLELVATRAGGVPSVWSAPPPAGRHWLVIAPSGAEGAKGGLDEEGRPFDPTGIGVALDVQTGAQVQRRWITSTGGYLASPPPRVHLGLRGAAKADYVRLTWPDGVLQSELEVPADQVWPIAKVKRKPSSCPVLFTWDGERFVYVTDFLGTGGVGFLLEPGVYAPADPTEDVWIPPGALVPRAGRLELRVAEPLEEVTWLDQLRLLAYDHPEGTDLWLDERFGGVRAATGAPWVVGQRLAPRAARDERGRDVLERIRAVDRTWPEVERHPRFAGYATDHALELDFGQDLAALPADTRLVLCLHGWIDYTYSHVSYAAAQAGLVLSPPALEVPDGAGSWTPVVADIGFPAGLPRPSTYDVTDMAALRQGRFRIRTSMAIFYDQVFLAVGPQTEGVVRHEAPLLEATLERLGVPREVSPDGRLPMGWDRSQIESAVPFRTMAGAYTRFGDVRDLLTATDDRFVTMAVGDEVALAFDATALPPLAPGHVRTYVLSSNGFCKDMDLYGAEPDTVGPVPYHAMGSYPPPAPHPDAALSAEMDAVWNTRVVPRVR